MSKRDKKIMVLNSRQREAITQSSARLEIVDAMSEIAPCSVAELAREIGRSPQSLYYHVEIMVKVGLLRKSGQRKAGKRDEALYDMVCDHFRLARSGDTAESKRRTLLRFSSTVLKLTERNYRDALSDGLVRRVGDRENIYIRRQRGKVSDPDLNRFYDLLEEMGSLMARDTPDGETNRVETASRRERTHSYALTVVLVPLEDHTEAAAPVAPAAPKKRRRRK